MGGSGWEFDAWHGWAYSDKYGLQKPVIATLQQNPPGTLPPPEPPPDLTVQFEKLRARFARISRPVAADSGGHTIDTLIVALSDLHAGLRLSLLNPATKTTETRTANGGRQNLTVTQRYLWTLYLQHRDQVRELRGERRLMLLLLGDLTQGLKHWAGVWGTTLYDHIAGALAALEPFLELEPAVIRLVAGTESHTQDGTSGIADCAGVEPDAARVRRGHCATLQEPRQRGGGGLCPPRTRGGDSPVDKRQRRRALSQVAYA